jgi:SAM-dependent methyltransferase
MTDNSVSQHWDAERYVRNAGFVADLGAPLLELLAAKPGERILDLGCGDGRLSLRIGETGALVIGVDGAPGMIDAARAQGVDAHVMDGQALTFHEEFDAVFSNAALHWMTDADAVIAGVRRVLKPGGRFVAEFGGGDNVKQVVAALVAALDRRGIQGRAFMPWYFPTDGEYGERLDAGGFVVDSIALMPRPTPLPGSVADWLDTFAESFLFAVPESEREDLKGEVVEALRPALCDDDGQWFVDYVRLRVTAHLT